MERPICILLVRGPCEWSCFLKPSSRSLSLSLSLSPSLSLCVYGIFRVHGAQLLLQFHDLKLPDTNQMPDQAG